MSLSQQKLLANRENARKSTGPRTGEGKARSARNAVSHGLFCRELLLPGESADELNDVRRTWIVRLDPRDEAELVLVERIVAASWRIIRLQNSEKQLLAEVLRCTYTVEAWALDREAQRLERLARHEQRLDAAISRALRELRQLREHFATDAGAGNPFLQACGQDAGDSKPPLQNEPTAAGPSPRPAPGLPGEAADDEPPGCDAEAQNEPTAAGPAPRPAPPSRERFGKSDLPPAADDGGRVVPTGRDGGDEPHPTGLSRSRGARPTFRSY